MTGQLGRRVVFGAFAGLKRSAVTHEDLALRVEVVVQPDGHPDVGVEAAFRSTSASASNSYRFLSPTGEDSLGLSARRIALNAVLRDREIPWC